MVEFLTVKNINFFSEFMNINSLAELLRLSTHPARTKLVDLFLHAKCCQRQTNRDKDAS